MAPINYNAYGSGCEWDVRQRWRAEDVEQQVLDNARELWRRNVAQNRRDAVRPAFTSRQHMLSFYSKTW